MVLRALAAAVVAVAVFIPLGALISAAPAGADPVIDPAGVSIGNGPQQFNGTYLNAQKIADSLAGAGVTVEATGQITIADPSDLSASPLGTPHFSLTLSAPVCNVDNNLNLGALGNLILDCGTLNFNAQITSGGPAIDPSRVTSTATQVNVLSNAASIQQAIDSSSPASPGTVQVSPGQYAGNLTIGHALTLTGNDGTSATGADPNAPTLAGAQPGGNVITVSADHVTVDGLHLNGTVGASPVSSTSGIFASGVDGLTVTHNTFDGFSGLSITTPGSTNVVSDMNDTIFDPTSVSIGNGTQLINGTYLNCQKIADNLVVTSITIQATGQISVVDPCDLSTSLNGTPHFNLSLVTPTLNINNGLNLAASGNLFLTVSTLNLNAQLTSGGTTIDPSRVTSTATQVNVLSNAASIQQAIDSSSPASADTVQVSPGQYAGNLSIGHALTLTGNDGTSATGADPGAPTLAGTQPGGTVITVTADNVTLDGLDLSGTVAGGSSDSSVYGILASGVDGLTVTHNTFGGFSGLSIATPGSTNVVLNANGPTDTITFDSEGGSTVGPVSGLDGTTVSLPDAPARAGYSFGGWYTAASGGSLATSPYLLAGSATLFAQWTANPKRATSTQVLCSPFSLSTGASTSCTATVTDTDSGAESWPQGAISWDNGGASGNFASSSCTLAQNGTQPSSQCTVNYTPTAGGSQAITGTYTPSDGVHAAGNPGSGPIFVSSIQNTATTVTSSKNPSTYGDSVTFTATIAPSPSGAGTVTFTDGATTLCNAVNVSGNTATCTTSSLSANGSLHAITASYSGATGFTSSSGSLSQTVNKATPTCSLTPYTVTYDGSAHTATGSCTGVSGEVLSGLDRSPTTHTSAGAYSDMWTFTDSTGNYADATGTVTNTIIKAAVHVDANAASKTYGDPDPAPSRTLRASDFQGSDTPATSGITGTANCSITSYSQNAGTYTGVISCGPGTLASANYTFAVGNTANLTINQATLTVTADDKSIIYGDPLPAFTYQVTGYKLTDTSAILAGSATCAASGTTGSPPGPAGTYPITCTQGTLSAGSNYKFSHGSGTLTISKKSATLGYTGGMFFSTGSSSATSASVTLQATITPAAGGSPDPTKAAPPKFLLYKSTNLTMATPDATCTATAVSSAGIASCTISSLGVDNWTVVVQEPSNGYFTAPDSDPVVMTVYQPATDKFATGGGWITDPSSNTSAQNKHGNFGMTVRYKNGTTTPSGQSVYVFRGADGYDYVIKSNSWTGGGLSFGTNTASFSGKANVTAIDPRTGLAVSGIGGGNYTYRVDVTDNGSTGDTYAISVYTPTGTLYHQAGTTSASGQLRLGGGNIVVHTP